MFQVVAPRIVRQIDWVDKGKLKCLFRPKFKWIIKALHSYRLDYIKINRLLWLFWAIQKV
jgi:hypothetical protein